MSIPSGHACRAAMQAGRVGYGAQSSALRRAVTRVAARPATYACCIAATFGFAATASAATPASFGTATNYGLSGGTRPTSVVVADVNGDGKPDVITTNRSTNNVSVLLGDGSGGLATATNYGLGGGTFPLSVAVADVNGDSHLDLAVANGSTNNVSVLLGDGAGGFGTATTFGLGGSLFPFKVVMADVNGDTHPDLVTANGNSDNVSVLLGDGSGSFGSATSFGLGGGDFPQSLAAGDVNADGHADVVTANNFSNNVSVLLGDGSGALGGATNFTVGSLPVSVALADLDGDGKLDIVTADGGAGASVLIGDGTGSFGSSTDFAAGASPTAVAVADVNGDTEPDIVTSNAGSSDVAVLLGDGAGGFGTATSFGLSGGNGPNGVAVADLNADGRPDLVAANGRSNNVSVLLNTLAPSCDGQMATIVGTNGSDTLSGTSGPDVIAGLGGNDVISGLGGNDVICGGDGNDTISAGAGNDRIFGQAGNDIVSAGDGNDAIFGGWGNDTISAGNGDDSIDGAAGWDICSGGSGTDSAINCETVSSVP